MLDLSFLTLRNILIWIGAWSLIGFVVMGEDKSLAKWQEGKPHPERVSERTLHEIALVGGFLGIIAGAKVFSHKKSKESFWPPVGASIVLWLILFACLIENGALPITP